jgi:hypothetical protein
MSVIYAATVVNLFAATIFAMAKLHYFFKLIPPRPTFPQDMSEAEKRLMEEHSCGFDEHLWRVGSFSVAR